MQLNQNDVAGSAVFWTLGENTDYSKVSAALSLAGFAKFTPEKMTEYAALKLTLETDFQGCEVFPVKGSPNTFEVVKVVRDSTDNKNEYRHILTARATGWQNVECDTHDGATEYRLTESYRRNLATVPYHSMSRALVDIVYSLQGTTLRPSGGIYWIPNAQFEVWQTIAQAIETAGDRNKVFALRTFLDENSAAVLREALSAEIAREASTIDATLHDPVTGLKAAATARKRARDLRAKIAAYEQAFEMALPDLKRALDQATGQEATAALMDAASAGPLLLFAESA